MSGVEQRFGEPSDRGAGRIQILKYGEIELHFDQDSLWLVHCEVWARQARTEVLSKKLDLAVEQLTWPLDVDAVVRAAVDHGLDPIVGDRFDGCLEIRAGGAVLTLDVEAEWIGCSVTAPTHGVV